MKFKHLSILISGILITFFSTLSCYIFDAEIFPVFETRSIYGDDGGNNGDADDPAIWINPADSKKSLVICSLKEAGLDVYDLSGSLVQHIAAGPGPDEEEDKPRRFNNADIIYGFKLNQKRIDIIVVSDRGSDRLRVYSINAEGINSGKVLEEITDSSSGFIFNETQEEVNDQRTVYGIAAAKMGVDGPYYVFGSRRERSTVAQLELFATKAGLVAYKKIRSIDLPCEFSMPDGSVWTPAQDEDNQMPQVEGMVYDPYYKTLYIGQEQVGIWRTTVTCFGKDLRLVDKVKEYGVPYTRTWDEEEEEYSCDLLWDKDPGFGGEYLSADVEGLTIYMSRNGRGYLITSSQGSDEFIVYDRMTNVVVGSFSIVDSDKVDGSQECDGAMVVNSDLGGDFSGGLFVVQDGKNTPDELASEGEERENTNFKFVRWMDIAAELNLVVDNYPVIR